MSNLDQKVPLLLFAKAPIAGNVKTRLQTHCNGHQAAEIAKILLEEAIRKCTGDWPGEVKLCAVLDVEDNFLQSIADKYSIGIEQQSDGDLGKRMYTAFERFGYPAAIMGCDAPHILPSTLCQAHKLLSENNNVIAPSDDGGYYFIGMAEPCSVLFSNISWGGEKVYSDTLVNASGAAWEHVRLPSLNDVDSWSDVLSVAKFLPSLNAYIRDQRLV